MAVVIVPFKIGWKGRIKMLDYTDFKKLILMRLKSALPDDRIQTEEKIVYKVNVSLEAIVLKIREDDDGITTGQVHYLEKLYENYQRGRSIDELVHMILTLTEQAKETKGILDGCLSFEACKDKILAQVIHREKNSELLKRYVHRDVLDLALIYRIVLANTKEGFESTIISDEMLRNWNVSEEELYKTALKNTQDNPYIIRNLQKVILKMKSENEPPMYVLSREAANFGASAIAYPEEIQKAESLFKDSFFILPSSQHDLLFVPYEASAVEQIKEMVREVNRNAVEIEDYLSDSVYYYDINTREIKVAV